jgi:gamma-glutamyltranspeptidase/glutathione hydrolase
MSELIDRRRALTLMGAGLTAGAPLRAEERAGGGCVVGWPEAAKAGQGILDAGGNAVDAAVGAALVATVVAPQMCGIGGYGGHMVLALGAKKTVTAIDFNTAAPAAARPEMFPLDAIGAVKGRINEHGWLAAGVPGVLAGMQLALDRYGTLPFRTVVQPAIGFARDGFVVETGLANSIRGARAGLLKEPASAKLLLDGGEVPRSGTRLRNPDLARMLESLAKDNSVAAFYHGEFARIIAAAMKEHGGLVTAADLAAYEARELEPLKLEWRGYTIHTAPLTAGGLTVLQALGTMRAFGWDTLAALDGKSTHAQLEALRLAWHDRLRFLGDPLRVKVPVDELLSEAHAKDAARLVETAVRDGKPAPAATDGRGAGGTIHLNAADRYGNMVALTLTHGNAFGAQVTVEGLGLTLGHGMSRFEPKPGHPNSPGPGKRPLHNMCPTVVTKAGRPALALGGRGGRKIPNSVFELLLRFVGRGASLEDALAAGRLHTEGGMKVGLDPRCSDKDVEYLRGIGYAVERSPGAVVSAVALDEQTGKVRGGSR